MKNRRKKLHTNKKLVVVLAILLSVGFAYITSAVNVGGVFTVFSSTYDVHFENLQVTDGSVEANTPTIDSENTEVSASVRFTNPGDYYEFTIDAVNAGDIDAMINTVSDIELTEDQEKYIDYTVTYADGEEPIKYHQLNSGDRCTFKVKASFKEDIETEDLPEDGDNVEVVLDTDYVKADSNRIKRRAEYNLYNVLKDEANSGSLAKKYTGEHQDSMDAALSTKDIYHWYAANETDGTTIKNRNNVIFANHCWQLIRTTDTGGARLLYNGEVENNQCLDTRGTHVGYRYYTNKNLNNNFYYGTDYTYDKTNNVFSISGDIEQSTWSDLTYEDLIGKYTCMKMTQNETCSEIYLIESFNNNASANVIPINSNSQYSQFGSLQFNKSESSIAYVGYMYNTVYDDYLKQVSTGRDIYAYADTSLTKGYWYADSVELISYNNVNTYKLINPYQINSEDNFSSVEGKYTLKANEANSTSSRAYYIASVSNSDTGYSFSIKLQDGHDLSYYNTTYTYGDSYTDNGDGTYTINSPSQFDSINYNSVKSAIKYKYACESAVNNTCSNLLYIHSTDSYWGPSYFKIENSYKFSTGYTYENGVYTLDDNNSAVLWNFAHYESYIHNKHYTCWNTSGECETISYVYSYLDLLGRKFYTIRLSDGKDIDDAIYEMLNSDDVNVKSSLQKTGVESWYKHKMMNYSEYIEDSIYCGERRLNDSTALNPQVNISNSRILGMIKNSNSLKCFNITDSYSTNNDLAKINYPVGLINIKDMTAINANGNTKIIGTGNSYFTMSPTGTNGTGYNEVTISAEGGPYDGSVTSTNGVRPYISLSPTTFYTSGDGSMENPYVIYTE